MYQKLFKITTVLFLIVVSIAAVAIIITALLSIFSSPLLARDEGITIVVGGVTDSQLAYMMVAASLFVAGCYLFLRRRRFHR